MRSLFGKASRLFRRPRRKPLDVLDEYVMQSPSDQNALDVFAGEWSSELPAEWKRLRAGHVRLFEDDRILWATEQMGGFRNRTVLELGPLEAGHTYMLESLGADSIVAVEASRRAYLKCLVVKEIVGLKRSRFLLGDAVSFLRHDGTRFDVCLASGVLYHMQNPAELIHLIAMRSEWLVLWTHFYDAGIIGAKKTLSDKFVGSVKRSYRGFDHTVHEYAYKDALGWAGFCGGGRSRSYWMSRDDILRCLAFFGFDDVRVGCEEPDHPNGPAFLVVARGRAG
jgi:hypothetical protein